MVFCHIAVVFKAAAAATRLLCGIRTRPAEAGILFKPEVRQRLKGKGKMVACYTFQLSTWRRRTYATSLPIVFVTLGHALGFYTWNVITIFAAFDVIKPSSHPEAIRQSSTPKTFSFHGSRQAAIGSRCRPPRERLSLTKSLNPHTAALAAVVTGLQEEQKHNTDDWETTRISEKQQNFATKRKNCARPTTSAQCGRPGSLFHNLALQFIEWKMYMISNGCKAIPSLSQVMLNASQSSWLACLTSPLSISNSFIVARIAPLASTRWQGLRLKSNIPPRS
jgi:hypothetical protein